MEPRYFYTDARGTRSGPFSESELERLAEIGSIDWAGSIELEGLGRAWRVSEVGWLADAMMRSKNRRRPVIDGTAVPIDEGTAPEASPEASAEVSAEASPEPSHAPTAGASAEAPPASAPEPTPQPAPSPWPPAPPRTPPTTPPATPLIEPVPTQASCSRATYILLALLPAFFGIFGIHNIVAGYPRGIAQLVLSLATFGGVLGLFVAMPCCCFGVPIWLVLFVWSLIDAVTVTRDAKGVLMR